MTPSGSACSVSFGIGITSATPGSAQGTELVVDDIDALRVELAGRGAEVSEVFHGDGSKRVPARTPNIAATSRTPRSAARTATTGCSRRSPPACRAGRHPCWWPTAGWPPWRTRCARRGGARQARGRDRKAGPGLAGVVRAVHGGRVGRAGHRRMNGSREPAARAGPARAEPRRDVVGPTVIQTEATMRTAKSQWPQGPARAAARGVR